MNILSPADAEVAFPAILALKKRLVYWDTGQSDAEFTREYFSRLRDSLLLIEYDEKKQIKHFAYINVQDKPSAFFWLIYSSKENPAATTQFVFRIKAFLTSLGFTEVEFKTNNVQLSYERWLKKFGSKCVAKTFKVSLT